MTMESRLIVVHGDKGGVGKSMVAMALIDYLMSIDVPVALIESDASNSDVRRMYENHVPNTFLALNHDPKSWIGIGNFIEENPDYVFVLNTPANIGIPMKKHFTIERIEALGIPVDLLWVINDNVDAENLMHTRFDEYGDRFRQRVVFFNEFFEAEMVDVEGATTFSFPALHKAVTKALQNNPGTSFQDALMQSGILRRGELGELIAFLKGTNGTRQLFAKALTEPIQHTFHEPPPPQGQEN